MLHICTYNEQAEYKQIIITCEMNHKGQEENKINKIG